MNHSHNFPFSFTVAKNNEEDRTLIYVNSSFSELTGFSYTEATGQNCKFLQGELTEEQHIQNIRESFKNNKIIFQDILNYKKSKEMFVNRLIIIPLVSGEESFLIGIQNNMKDIKTEQEALNYDYQSYKTINLSANDISHYLNNPLTIFLAAAIKNDEEKMLESILRIRDFMLNIDDRIRYPRVSY